MLQGQTIAAAIQAHELKYAEGAKDLTKAEAAGAEAKAEAVGADAEAQSQAEVKAEAQSEGVEPFMPIVPIGAAAPGQVRGLMCAAVM